MGASPDRHGAREQRAAGARQFEPPAASVVGVDHDRDEAAPLQQLERGGERGAEEATEPMVGGSGRFSDIIIEYCPLVRPMGRSATSKRRASARAARCRCRHRQ